MSVTLKQLEAFIWVADLGGFHAAADRLNTTQPNISNRIASLEKLVGAALFDRRPGTVSLTPKGRQLIDLARATLDAQKQFLAEANSAALTQGTLRLGVTEMIVHTWLRPFLIQLKEEFPKLVVDLTVDMAQTLGQHLQNSQLDLAFMNDPFEFPAISVDLGEYEMAWVASPDLNLMDPITAADMVQHPLLTHARGTWPHLIVVDHFRGQNVQIAPSANLGTCVQMAVDGLGIAMVPRAMAAEDLKAGRLKVLNYAWLAPALRFAARYLDKAPGPYVRRAAQIASNIAKR